MHRSLALAAALVLAACQQDPPGTCAAHFDCNAGQECSGGVCVALATDHQVGSRCVRDADCVAWAGCAEQTCTLAAGMCTTGADCAGWQLCDNGHACISAAGRCASAAQCAAWEVCNASNTCENGPGYCASRADCAAWQTCNTTIHACATATGFCADDAACAGWQYCAADHQCDVVPGMCGSSADCASWDLCDTTHVCAHGPGYCATNGACSPWEECSAVHACVAAPGFCNGAAECQSWQQCNATHTCETAPGFCASGADCATWQQCGAAHACVAAPGFCAGSADCRTWEVCSGTSHACENGPGYCASSADCASWQQCDAVHACVAAPGFCGANGDCQVWEACNGTSHICENGPGYCASSTECASWQQCNAVHACVAAPGFCGAAADCQWWEVCNGTSHTCENGPGYCGSKADCENWKECDASHTCRLAWGCCEADIDCAYRFDDAAYCGADHMCTPTAGHCLDTTDCPAQDVCGDPQTYSCVRADGWCASDADCRAPETCSSLGICFNAGSGGADWIRRIGSDAPNAMATENTAAHEIACADDGDLVAHLYAGGVVDPGDGVFRSGHLFVSLAAADGAVQWVKTLEKGGRIEGAPGGDVVIAGYAPGDLGAGPVPSRFVARLAGDGTVRWQQALTDGPMDMNVVAVSPSSEIVVAGPSYTVAGGSITEWWNVVTKLDATGAVAWTTRPIDDKPGGIAAAAFDAAGNVVLAVTRIGLTLSDDGGLAIIVLDGATGARLSYREHGTDAQGRPTYLARISHLDVAADGSVLVAGAIRGDISFGGALLHVFYGTDAFALKLGPTGDFAWNVQARASAYSEYDKHALATRLPDGTTYLVGIYSFPVEIGGFTVGSSAPTTGAYLARIDADGVVTTVTPFRHFGSELEMFDLCSSNGHIGWIDHHWERLMLGGRPADAAKVQDAFVARLNP